MSHPVESAPSSNTPGSEGVIVSGLKIIANGTSEFPEKAVGENLLNFAESAHEFMPGITKGGSTGGDVHH